jgi:sortase A
VAVRSESRRGASSSLQRLARLRRPLGLALIVAGVLALIWTIVVWQWQDPFTALYTKWEQHKLAQQYDRALPQWEHRLTPPASSAGNLRATVSREAAAYRRDTHPGQAIGRIIVGRLGLDMVLVDGTDEGSLKKGPGRDPRTYMPGQNRLVYIAGHRTTYLAPFSHIEDIRNGDYIKIEVPYATFTYRAFRHEIVPATDIAMLRSPNHELLRLQACHPRFFATHRYIVDAKLVSVLLPNGRSYQGVSGT